MYPGAVENRGKSGYTVWEKIEKRGSTMQYGRESLSPLQIDALHQKRLFLFDMDGTIYLDNDIFDGTLDILRYIREVEGKAVFVTNNSSKSVEGYVEKMAGLGIRTSKDDFMTSAQATGLHLKKFHRGGKIYVFGTDALFTMLRDDYTLPVTKSIEEDVTCLLIAYDTELTFQKMEDASRLLLSNPDLIYLATNPDLVCPRDFGYVPDCGALAQSLFYATGRRPKVIGKPEPAMALLAMEKYGFIPEETVLLGDRVYTDIRCGVSAGIDSILVLSGESTMETVEQADVKPTMILRDVRELYRIMTED